MHQNLFGIPEVRAELHHRMHLRRTLTKLVGIKAFKHYALENKNLAGFFVGNKSQTLMVLPSLDTNSWLCALSRGEILRPVTLTSNPSRTSPPPLLNCAQIPQHFSPNCRMHRCKLAWGIYHKICEVQASHPCSGWEEKQPGMSTRQNEHRHEFSFPNSQIQGANLTQKPHPTSSP